MRHRIQILVLLCTVLLVFTGMAHAQNKTLVIVNGAADSVFGEVVQTNLSQFLTAVNVAFHEGSEPALDDAILEAGQQAFERLWHNIPFFCPFTDLSVDLLQTSSGFEIRNIPLVLKAFDDAGKRQRREGVFLLSKDGQITDVHFGLESHQYEALLRNPANETDLQRKQIILNFVENVRTAYNRKDLPLIERVYSDNALIIIGRVVVEERSDQLQQLSSPRIAYIKRKKSEYIEQLRKVFETNELVHLDFEDLKIVRHPVHQDIYGVTLLQYWESSNYSDAGYLFLMVDFREEERPIIHVRTWQPKVEVTEGEVFQLNDFWINTNSN